MRILYPHFVIIFILMECQQREMKAVSQPYIGYKVLNTIPETNEQLNYLQILANHSVGLENVRFWNYPAQKGTAVFLDVHPDGIKSIKNMLQQKNIPFWITVDNLQESIDYEREMNRPVSLTNYKIVRPEKFDLKKYHTLDEIESYLQAVNSAYDDIVTIKKFGRSFEERNLQVVQIKKHSGSKRPIILLEAGTHAREWISPATALYLISRLIDEEDQNAERLLENFDWLIIPVMNPDGYVYTWNSDRLWRKNRRIFFTGRTFKEQCNGVDLNRNYDIGYEEKDKNSKYFYCTEIFAGTEPFSEPETRALRDFVLPLKSRIKLYISLHSFSQIWITPYIYKKEIPSDYDRLRELATKAADAMESVNGNIYTYGPGSLQMYQAKGTSADWFYEKANVTYSFILELPDKGEHGFLLPNDQIIPVGREVWSALKAITNELSYMFI